MVIDLAMTAFWRCLRQIDRRDSTQSRTTEVTIRFRTAVIELPGDRIDIDIRLHKRAAQVQFTLRPCHREGRLAVASDAQASPACPTGTDSPRQSAVA